MTQASVNGGLEILVEASINRDPSSGLIGTKILSFASAEQIATAREYCRIKHRFTSRQIDTAISGEMSIKDSLSPADSGTRPAKKPSVKRNGPAQIAPAEVYSTQ